MSFIRSVFNPGHRCIFNTGTSIEAALENNHKKTATPGHRLLLLLLNSQVDWVVGRGPGASLTISLLSLIVVYRRGAFGAGYSCSYFLSEALGASIPKLKQGAKKRSVCIHTHLNPKYLRAATDDGRI